MLFQAINMAQPDCISMTAATINTMIAFIEYLSEQQGIVTAYHMGSVTQSFIKPQLRFQRINSPLFYQQG
jgi:hypothetical protein